MALYEPGSTSLCLSLRHSAHFQRRIRDDGVVHVPYTTAIYVYTYHTYYVFKCMRVYIYILCIYSLLYVPRIQNSTLICGRNPGQVEDPPELLHKVNLEIEHRHSHSVVGGKHVYIPTDRDIHGYSKLYIIYTVSFWKASQGCFDISWKPSCCNLDNVFTTSGNKIKFAMVQQWSPFLDSPSFFEGQIQMGQFSGIPLLIHQHGPRWVLSMKHVPLN